MARYLVSVALQVGQSESGLSLARGDVIAQPAPAESVGAVEPVYTRSSEHSSLPSVTSCARQTPSFSAFVMLELKE